MAQSPLLGHVGAAEGSPYAPRLLLQNAHFTILLDELTGIVRTVRSNRPFTSLEELQAVYEELIGALDGIDRSSHVLLVDVRAAPGRNDPQFEATMERVRHRWLRGFRRIGVLVSSAVGALQIQRYAKRDGIERFVTSDEAELLRYLTQDS